MLRLLLLVQLLTVLTMALPIKEDLEDIKYMKILNEIRMKSSGYPDYSLGKKLKQLTPDSKVNPEELGSYFEGDILHDPMQDRNGKISKKFRWPSGEVPYKIDKKYSSNEVEMIEQAMQEYHDNTCIKFRPYNKTDDQDYVSIEKAEAGCFARSIGRIGGKQVVNLQTECFTKVGTPIHELMHAIGFFHEQSRMERDKYVEILWENIIPALPIKEDVEDENYMKILNEIRMKSRGFPDYSLGKKLEQLTPDSKVNPEELGSYFEGDILHDPLQNRNGLTSKQFRWPNAEVPYKIDKRFNSRERKMIEEAMEAYHQNTCIKFRPYKNSDRDYISIEKTATGCFSSVGRIGGMQIVNLEADGCLNKIGTPIHEFMHAIGFLHEQSRMERDKYVKILWENIEPGQEHNFQKYVTTGFGIKYDYGSVMHYGTNYFSINEKPTIEPKKLNVSIGQREGFSDSDIAKINAMYKC